MFEQKSWKRKKPVSLALELLFHLPVLYNVEMTLPFWIGHRDWKKLYKFGYSCNMWNQHINSLSLEVDLELVYLVLDDVESDIILKKILQYRIANIE